MGRKHKKEGKIKLKSNMGKSTKKEVKLSKPKIKMGR